MNDRAVELLKTLVDGLREELRPYGSLGTWEVPLKIANTLESSVVFLDAVQDDATSSDTYPLADDPFATAVLIVTPVPDLQ